MIGIHARSARRAVQEKVSASQSRSTRPAARSSSSSHGRVSYAYVGVTTQDVTPRLAKKFGFAAPRGASWQRFSRIRRPPARGFGVGREWRADGVQVSLGGDVIIRIGTTPMASAQDVSRAVALHRVGEKVPFTVLRDGKTRRIVQVTLAERPA